MQQPSWLPQAWRELGVSEGDGRADNPRVVAYYGDAGHPEVTHDEVAWCAAFVGACLKRGGYAPSGSLMARSYLDWGRRLDAPEVGAIAIFSRGSDPAAGHVGFWLGTADDDIVLLGGNQGSAVTVARVPAARLLGLRWPDAATAAHAGRTSADDGRPAASRDPEFNAALAHVLEMEGGFTDDRFDPGGPTNLGITLGEYASWRREVLAPESRERLVSELKRLPQETAAAIYRARYWDAGSCAALPPGLSLMHFDAAVNHGLGTAARILQEAADAEIDGEIGPETLAAARNAGRREILTRYADLRRARYRALSHFWRFGRGWLARVDTTLALALERAGADPSPSPSPTEGDTTMTNDTTSDTLGAEPKWWGNSLTIWGALVSGFATIAPILGPILGLNLSADLVRDAGAQLTDLIQIATALAGTVMTILGRVRASQPLMRRSFNLKV